MATSRAASRPETLVRDASQFFSLASRRQFLRTAMAGGVIVLVPSVLAGCSDENDDVTGPNRQADQTITLDLRTDTGIFNFLYLFEQTEVAFYDAAVASPAFAGMPAEHRELLTDLRAVETVHREFLRRLLGSAGAGELSFNQSTIVAAATTGASILRTAEMLEDTGVATQIGLAKYITNVDWLNLAGKVNSMEARHAAALRDVREAAGIAAVGQAGTRFAGDDIVVPTGNFAGLNAKIEYPAALAAVDATDFVRNTIQVGQSPTPEAGTPDFAPPSPTP